MYRKFRVESGDESTPASNGTASDQIQNVAEKKRTSESKIPAKEEQRAKDTKENKGTGEQHKVPSDDVSSSGANASTTAAKVESSWAVIEDQRTKEMKRRGNSRIRKQMSGWKTIRVFVSSTFTDMHSEREILVKKVKTESNYYQG